MSNSQSKMWTVEDLHNHLSYAIDLEFWTIPFYRTALASLPADAPSTVSDAIDDVSVQEMFHCQCAWNIANAFGTPYDFTKRKFSYKGTTIPHLDFSMESPDPTQGPVTISEGTFDFSNYSAELNPDSFDERINAMCLVEYPDWQKPSEQELEPDVSNYPSIGHFYAAIKTLMQPGTQIKNGDQVVKIEDLLTAKTKGQTNVFVNQKTGAMPLGPDFGYTITESGAQGLAQVVELINAIVEEGEGTSSSSTGVPTQYQFNGSDVAHFNAFLSVKGSGTISQKAMVSGGVDSIMKHLSDDFLPAVQTMFSDGGSDRKAFMHAMFQFSSVVGDAFGSSSSN